jgi:hypothetical protein
VTSRTHGNSTVSEGTDQSVASRDERQDNERVLSQGAEDKSVVPELRHLLRDAIDESSWRGKHEALAVAMRLPDRFYLSKMLNGTKPIGTKHLKALPDDVEVIFAKKYAETFGLIVVAPTHGADAARAFVTGLFGLLAPAPSALPEKAGPPVRATLRATAKAATR